MRLDELRPTRYAEDRRGSGGGLAVGGIGLIVIVVAAYLFGFDPQQVLDRIGANQPVQQTQSGAAPTMRPINTRARSWVRPKTSGHRSSKPRVSISRRRR
jgi:predicted metalloprotease